MSAQGYQNPTQPGRSWYPLTSVRLVQLLLCFMLALTSFASAQITPWNKIQSPPLPAFAPQEPVRVQLPNGMVLFLQEDHELPLISATARIRGGAISEPANKTGTYSMFMATFGSAENGGDKTRTGDQMDDFLETRARQDRDRQSI